MTTSPNNASTLTVDNFPSDLRRQFKMICASQDITVREGTIQAVRMWTDAHMDHGVAALPGRPQAAKAAHEASAKVQRK